MYPCDPDTHNKVYNRKIKYVGIAIYSDTGKLLANWGADLNTNESQNKYLHWEGDYRQYKALDTSVIIKDNEGNIERTHYYIETKSPLLYPSSIKINGYRYLKDKCYWFKGGDSFKIDSVMEKRPTEYWTGQQMINDSNVYAAFHTFEFVDQDKRLLNGKPDIIDNVHRYGDPGYSGRYDTVSLDNDFSVNNSLAYDNSRFKGEKISFSGKMKDINRVMYIKQRGALRTLTDVWDYYGNTMYIYTEGDNFGYKVGIDSNNPNIGVYPQTDKWFNKDVMVSVSGRDYESGIRNIELWQNQLLVTRKTDDFNYTERKEGINQIKAIAYDNVGNSKEQNFQIKIDKTLPVVEGIPIDKLYLKDVAINLIAKDNLSGMASITLLKEGKAVATGVDSINYIHREDGSFVYSIVAVDNAGNVYNQNFILNKESNKLLGLANLYRVDKLGEVKRERINGPITNPLFIYTNTLTGMEIESIGASLLEVEFYKNSVPIDNIIFTSKDTQLVNYDGVITLYDEKKLRPGDKANDNKVTLKVKDPNKTNTNTFDFILPTSVEPKSIISMKLTCYNEGGNKINNDLGKRFFIIRGNPYKDININNIR